MKDWFENLEARERLFVSIGAVVVALSLIYGFVWAPLDRNHAQVTASVSDWQQSLAELRPLKGVVQNTAASTPRFRCMDRRHVDHDVPGCPATG